MFPATVAIQTQRRDQRRTQTIPVQLRPHPVGVSQALVQGLPELLRIPDPCVELCHWLIRPLVSGLTPPRPAIGITNEEVREVVTVVRGARERRLTVTRVLWRLEGSSP